MNSVKSVLRAEFINRLDEILFYTRLGKSDISKIVDLELKTLQSKLNEDIRDLDWFQTR